METEEERGVAHIVEHLAFSATKQYSNHDIVKFLESIGAEFGACQNAYTSADETVFELMVPIDKEGLLGKALSVLAEFSSEVGFGACEMMTFTTFFFLFFWVGERTIIVILIIIRISTVIHIIISSTSSITASLSQPLSFSKSQKNTLVCYIDKMSKYHVVINYIHHHIANTTAT